MHTHIQCLGPMVISTSVGIQSLLTTPTTSPHPRPLEIWVWKPQCGWANSFLSASVLPLSQAEKMVLGRLDEFSKPEVRPLPAILVSPIIPSRLPWAEPWSLDSHFIYTYFSSGDPWVEKTWVTFSPEARSLPARLTLRLRQDFKVTLTSYSHQALSIWSLCFSKPQETHFLNNDSPREFRVLGDLFILSMSVLVVCMCAMCIPGTRGDQKNPDPPQEQALITTATSLQPHQERFWSQKETWQQILLLA